MDYLKEPATDAEKKEQINQYQKDRQANRDQMDKEGYLKATISLHIATGVFFNDNLELGLIDIEDQVKELRPKFRALNEIGWKLDRVVQEKADKVFWFIKIYSSSADLIRDLNSKNIKEFRILFTAHSEHLI